LIKFNLGKKGEIKNNHFQKVVGLGDRLWAAS